MSILHALASALPVMLALATGVAAQQAFVNFESPHVHPLDRTPDGTRLLAVNTPDNQLEVFDITGGTPVALIAIPVGLDPVSVRARNVGHVTRAYRLRLRCGPVHTCRSRNILALHSSMPRGTS